MPESAAVQYPLPPLGWELNSLTGICRYIGRPQFADWRAACSRLVVWGVERNVYLEPDNGETFVFTDLYRVEGISAVHVDPTRPSRDSSRLMQGIAPCRGCGAVTMSFGRADCTNCGTSMICGTCRIIGFEMGSGRNCVHCAVPCSRCERGDAYVDGLCRTCYNMMVWCEGCGEQGHREDDNYRVINNFGWYCPNCQVNLCETCESQFLGANGRCAQCPPEEFLNPVKVDDYDYGVQHIHARDFSFERGHQLTSVEIEFGGNDNYVAGELYSAGLSLARETGGYHGGGSGTYVEYDGSVDEGGEMIISRLHLPVQEEAKRLYQSVDILRGAIKAGECRLTTQCGVHVHVDVGKYDLDWVMSAAVVYNYLESTLYHIASAGWKRGHRGASSGNDYAKTTPKGLTSKERFQESFGRDRYFGLNASPYFYARRQCNCSAGFENGSNCTCPPRSKSTLEFRLWNTTANGTKIMAYVAIPQAIVAFAKGKQLTANDLPDFEWGYEEQPHNGDAQMHAERLQWMFENLPFSPEERNAVRYCIRNSGLGSLIEESTLDSSLKQGILHEDELLNLPDNIVHVEDEDMAPAEELEPTVFYNEDDWGMEDEPYEPYFDGTTFEGCDCQHCQRTMAIDAGHDEFFDSSANRWRDTHTMQFVPAPNSTIYSF